MQCTVEQLVNSGTARPGFMASGESYSSDLKDEMALGEARKLFTVIPRNYRQCLFNRGFECGVNFKGRPFVLLRDNLQVKLLDAFYYSMERSEEFILTIL